MRRTIMYILVLVTVLSLTGCGSSEKQEELIDYINNDLAELVTLENEMLESYGSVTGDNYSNDIDMYTEFTTNTVELARKLYDKAVEISEDIADEKILEVHRLYLNYSNKSLNVTILMVSALEKQDVSLMVEANEKLNEANNYALDYKEALSKLAEEYNVEIQE